MSRRNFCLGAGIVALALADPAVALPPGFKQQADALLAASYPADGPGAAVVISEKGRIVYRGARGLADIDAKRPITPQTVFRIGSITKQFSAAVVLQLAAEGKLKLSDPISKYFPDYPQPGASATVAQLLNHTVGIQSYTGIPGWMVEANTNRAYTSEQLMAVFKDLPAPSKPGEKFDYNNSGYILVGALIEKVTGNGWAAEVERRIGKPLGLATLRDGTNETQVAAMAVGYTDGENGPERARKIHMSVPGAAGALIANAEDLATWGNALHHARVVPAPYYAQMIAKTKLADGTFENYGFGLSQSQLRGSDAVGHGGGIFGFSSNSIYIPSNDLFVAVLTNSDEPQSNPGMVMRKLSALAIGKPYASFETVALDKATVEPLLGVYQFDEAKRTVAMTDGKLSVRRNDGPETELFAAGNGRFHYGPDELSWFEISRDATGKPVMAFRPGGEDDVEVGTWSGPVPLVVEVAVPRDKLAAYAGIYTTPMGKATIALSDGDKLTIQLAGQPTLAMRATSDSEFAVDKVGAKVSFASEGGKVSGLEIDHGGRKLPGTRD
ncbi:MAG: serine hydrolase [Pseudomonadota bacterium]|nr:serine hydrolase [Pseudomonadota bacterium]